MAGSASGEGAAQARAVLETIPEEHRRTDDRVLARLSGRASGATDHDRLAAALLVNARACGGRRVDVLLELQADAAGLDLRA